ncbi:MAG: hypothetical protein RLZ04_2551 [Actinomycetota bacterium]|jgi:hypothetical protein
MAWDSTRPVPWKRLLIEWAVIGAVVIVVSGFTNPPVTIESLISVVLGGGIYTLVGVLLAKFGYQRKTLKQLRAEAAAAAPRSATTTAPPRPRPAPTSRTGGGTRRKSR